ncbi:hypothetical protein CYMTET_49303 [Cymbomonas tetramitiformis]|uniref:ER membrane protein complex subunit 3 n=1 Tax=Cymbomonas tetramitiformis TaxID=36881 RepID=A0AAE0BRQ3_9CHLO|nr:hypothetical protein CYMTET_49303 [Cymbomonas tetramitiformis]
MFLLGVLRHFVSKLMKGSDRKVELKTVREGQSIIRSQRLRTNAGYIPATAFGLKKVVFTNKETGVFHENVESKTPANPFQAMGQPTDPSQLLDMMKKNLSMVVPQILTFNWVNFFFSGFVVAKVPFPLTMRFRGMLQRGIELQALDVTYVSSLSWYFLNLIGLRGLFSIVLGENTIDDTQIMQQQMTMGVGDAPKAYIQERENLELLKHQWILPVVEKYTEKLLMDKLGIPDERKR